MGLGLLIALVSGLFEEESSFEFFDLSLDIQIEALIAIVLVLFCAKTLIVLFANKTIFSISAGIEAKLKQRYVSLFISQLDLKYRSISKADILTNLFTVIPNFIQKTVLSSLKVAVDALAFFTLLGFICFYYSLVVLIPVAIIVLLMTIFSIIVSRSISILGVICNKSVREQTNLIDQGVSGIVELRIENKHSNIINEFVNRSDTYAKNRATFDMVTGSMKYFIELISILSICTCLYLVTLAELSFKSSGLDMSVIIVSATMLALRGIPLLSSAAIWKINFSYGLVSFEKYKEYDKALQRSLSMPAEHLVRGHNLALIVDNVSLIRGSKSLMSNYSENFYPGDRVFVSGDSGTGKSSFLSIISGAINPDAGSIVFPRIKEGGSGDSDDIFAYMGQDPFFIEGTLRDNLTILANEKVNDEELLDGLSELGLSGWLSKLPNKLDTYMVFDDTMSSGGQRQRLAILRALFADRQVFLFDEATNALDSKNEAMAFRYIEKKLKKDSIAFFVSHQELPDWLFNKKISSNDFLANLQKGSMIK